MDLEISEVFFLFGDRLLEAGGVNFTSGFDLTGQLNNFVAGMDGFLVASYAGIRADREGVPCCNQTHDWVLSARCSIHVAVRAFQA